MTAFAAIIPRQPAAERTGVSEIATALSAVYGTPCESAAFDGCVLLAAPLVPGSDSHLLIDSTVGIAATGQVLLEDRRGLSGALGLPPHSHSLQLAAAAYQRWGATCTERLGGEFALAMWNVRDRAFLCARDGLGVRPLFVATGTDVVVVSNILGAARAHPHVAQDLDERALRGFLATGGIVETRTAYRAIVPLPAGHTLTIHGGESTLRRHWIFPAADGPLIRDPRSAIEGYREALEGAVGDRLEGRTAILMSSGIDSTTIAAAARRVTTAATLRAFTASYARVPASSEVPLAQTAAGALGIPITPVPADRYAALHHLSHGRPTPQPVDEPALSDWRALIGAAATHAGAALYGEDGDALFQPPGWQDLRRAAPLFSLAADVARFALSAHRLPYLGLRLRERVGLTEPRALPPPPRWLFPDPQAASADADNGCVLGHRPARLQHHATRSEAQRRLCPAVSAYLAGILTPELTGHRLELRCPLLDTRVIRFVVNVAPIPWCQRKALARAAYADMLPATITRRPKRGLAGLDVALARDWQRGHAVEAVETPLAPPLDEWIAPDEWRRALRSPDAQVVAEAWRVLQLGDWLAGRGNAVSVQGASCTA